MLRQILKTVVRTAVSLLFRLYKRWWRPRSPAVFERILVFSTGGIGDTLSDTPAVRAVRQSFADARIEVVADRRRAVIWEGNPDVAAVHTYRKSVLTFLRLAAAVRNRYDLSIVLRANDPDIYPLAYLASRNVLANPHRTQMPFLVTRPHADPRWRKRHGVEQMLDVVSEIGAKTSDPRLVLMISDREASEAEQRLRSSGVDPRAAVAVQVGGSGRQYWREWPASSFAALLDLLHAARPELTPILIGGLNLRDKACEILRLCRKAAPLNFVNATSLRQTAALLSVAGAMVTTDTGIMHVGYAVGCPTVAILHCSIPQTEVGPYGYDPKRYRILELRPPQGTDCSESLTLASIPPNLVLNALLSLLT